MSVVEIWSCYGFNNKWSHSRVTRRCSLWLLLQRAPTKFPLCLQTWRSHVCNDASCRQPTLWLPLCCLLLNKEAAWLSKLISLLGVFYKYLFNASNFMQNRNGHMARFEVEKREEGGATYGRSLWRSVYNCYKLIYCKFLSQVPSSGARQERPLLWVSWVPELCFSMTWASSLLVKFEDDWILVQLHHQLWVGS